MAGTYIENLNWADCIERYDRPHTLFYLDPPYWETEGYGVDFPFSEYERMAQLMCGMKGKAIVSLNDHPDIRRCFAEFEMEAVDINYTVGGGQGGGEKGGGDLQLGSSGGAGGVVLISDGRYFWIHGFALA